MISLATVHQIMSDARKQEATLTNQIDEIKQAKKKTNKELKRLVFIKKNINSRTTKGSSKFPT
jgi:hypothetical protein